MDAHPGELPLLDEDQYREQVLGISLEAEHARAQRLSDEARRLGLKLLEIEASAPLAASIASGMVDLSSSVLSSGSSTDRNSICDGSITPSREPSSPSSPASPAPSPLDQVASSLSEITIASERIKPGSTRSLASLSTRPTSYCSSESRAINGGYGLGNHEPLVASPHRMSMLSIASVDKKERRRSSLKNAIGRIHFRKKRRPSTVVLPPHSQITVSKGDGGGVEHVYLESRPKRPATSHEVYPNIDSSTQSLSKLEFPLETKLEIPMFDKETLQRSLEDSELGVMRERHHMERDRHLTFQATALSILRQRHQAALSERQLENQRLEDAKQEKNTSDAIRMEERQLAVEMEQQREFDRAKMNSRTRIKHMEGYFRNASPPPSPAQPGQRSSGSFSGGDTTPPTRRFTKQHKEQLEQQYHDHESMDALHEARIKVLRDRQELRLQETIARWERELNDLREQNRKKVVTLQGEHRSEETALIQDLDTKKTALRHRWHLEEAILRGQLEERYGQLYGPLPPVSFSVTSTESRDPAIGGHDPSPLGPGRQK
ncbi:hypothetical protein N7462_001730 [Penicillium macrosclerotiorum]|uniref:uncharacterized protein n=1 Tax=Penicillium macrosclerotiorum TaxID=303699 RepID=UPI002547A635|nr:uncharacterized protein N7462_001730 [Penicillium macrosclerotiorum]KAJ5692307.1 hypothetical protein N7462_001730 [Penicillium macrosclerotiorum]